MATATSWRTTRESSSTWRQPYRDIAAKKGIIFPPIDHLHDGRAVETPPLRDGREKVGPDGWLQFLEDVGIDWTVMYPTQGLGYGKIVSLDYAVAACKAYNDWTYHTYLQRDPRFNAMGLIPMQDTEEAVKELRRIVTETGHDGRHDAVQRPAAAAGRQGLLAHL